MDTPSLLSRSIRLDQSTVYVIELGDTCFIFRRDHATTTYATLYLSYQAKLLVSDHSCMFGHTYSKRMDQPGKVVNPTRGQLNTEN